MIITEKDSLEKSINSRKNPGRTKVTLIPKNNSNAYFFVYFLGFIMPYVYVGHPSIYHGKKLFKILCQLKNYGQGRIVYRSTEQLPGNKNKPSFYRILLAQPEMDSKLENGRVVAEKIEKGRRRLEPFILSEEAQFPDFNLVPKDQEAAFCQWDKVKDFVHERDAEAKPKWIEMPPLLKLYVQRNRRAHGEGESSDDLKLPAHKIYQSEHRLEDRIEPSNMSHYLRKKFAKKDFEVNEVPIDEWNFARFTSIVGHKVYLDRVEGTRDYKKLVNDGRK